MDIPLMDSVKTELHTHVDEKLEDDTFVKTDEKKENSNFDPGADGVQEGIKYCRNCGNKLPSSAKFCDKCGTKMDY